MNNIEFKPWPKIPRGADSKVVITEKIDGSNACIVISNGKIVGVQSRKRFITPEDDNFGFASWVMSNEEELLKLGEGHHFGEWAGEGIQKNKLNLDGKVFFLFNTFRWGDHHKPPSICSVVPVLYDGILDDTVIKSSMELLLERSQGKPEGIVVYHKGSRSYEKYTFENPKGKWMEDLIKNGPSNI